MSAQPVITIKFSPQAEALLARVADPRVALQAIRRGMDEANQITIGVIQKDFLSFPKSGKPVAEGLRVITNRLRGSVRASKAKVAGDTVTSSIGTNVKYAAIHEFGGTVKRVLMAGSVRLRTDKRGNLLRQGKNGRLAVFARKTQKLATTVSYFGGKRYEAVYPARAPFRRGIAKSAAQASAIVSRHIITALNGGQP